MDNPRVLVGTTSKARHYLYSPFPQLLAFFQSHLERTDTVVACGLSLGDEGIRAYLAQWLSRGASRRLLIIDPNASDVKLRLLKHLDWQNHGRVDLIGRGIQDVSWQEVKDWLPA